MPAEESQPMCENNPSSGPKEDFYLTKRNRAIIFANGQLNHPTSAKKKIGDGDLIVAADGGAAHCLRLGIKPHILIGDLDSLGADDLATLKVAGVQIIRHPQDKDYTDLELAILHVHDEGIGEVLVFGALGARWDQSLANLLLPAAASFIDLNIRLLDGPQEVFSLYPDKNHEIHGRPGDTLSLIPLAGDAYGVSTRGLQYSLKGETLYFGSSRGISNVFLRTPVNIKLDKGLLMCMIIHHE
jgi:thiamine pyrophosphokinase